jgi:hypothetical protein
MTLVVGLAHGGRVYMGTDSAETGVSNLGIRRDPQIVWKGAFLFGIPGNFRLENLVRYYLDVPDVDPGPDARAFLTRHVAAPLRDWILNNQLEVEERANSPEYDGMLLVGYPGRLFTIGPNGQVVEARDGYDALGTGDEVALGALRATRTEQDPALRVFLALHAAEYLTGAVRAPVHAWSLNPRGQCEKCVDVANTPIAYRQ